MCNYKSIRKRIENYKGKGITDLEIIEEQEKEIEQYRKRIEQLTEQVNELYNTKPSFHGIIAASNEETTIEQMIDSTTETFYADGEIIKEVTTYYK